jgi:hypothetical protein
VDCLSGEDEELCSELETNECSPSTEYRCKNGHCIPRDFFFDDIRDCLDGSDEIVSTYDICHVDMLWFCEDTTCDPYRDSWISGVSMSFSCGDGQCREMANVDILNDNSYGTLFKCGSGRDLLYTQRLFESKTECLEYLKCSFKFDLFERECRSKCQSKANCSNQISVKCANQSLISFPSKPIFDNHVFFVYELNKTRLWYINYLPSFICFDSIRCSQYKTTHKIDGRTCSPWEEFKKFHQNRSHADWRGIYITLQIIFEGCALPGKEDLIVRNNSIEKQNPISIERFSNSIQKIFLSYRIDGPERFKM